MKLKRKLIELLVYVCVMCLVLALWNYISVYFFNIYDAKFGGRWQNFLFGLEITALMTIVFGVFHFIVLLIYPVYTRFNLALTRSVIAALTYGLLLGMISLVEAPHFIGKMLFLSSPVVSLVVIRLTSSSKRTSY